MRFVATGVEQVCWHYFFNNIGSLCVSVLHLGNSPISNFFIIMFATMLVNYDKQS